MAVLALPARLLPTLILALLVIATFASATPSAPSYRESLAIDTLPDGKLLLAFDFTASRPILRDHGLTTKNASAPGHDHSNDYSLFPRTLGQILDAFDVEALELSLTQGRWHAARWGVPDRDYAMPPGADLKAWLRSGSSSSSSSDDVEKDSAETADRWLALTNALSGLVCGSINYLGTDLYARPALTFADREVTRPFVDTHFRHGALAREAVCTENLAPWTRLLPCGSQRGLARILNGYKLFDANYNSIQTRVRTVCRDGDSGRCAQELMQSLVVVADPMRSDGIPDWTLGALFERSIDSVCGATTEPTLVSITLPSTSVVGEYQLTSDPTRVVDASDGRRVAVYDVRGPVDIGIQYRRSAEEVNGSAAFKAFRNLSSTHSSSQHLPLSVTRAILGTDQDRGVLDVHLTNHHATAAIPVVYYDVLPWFLRVYMHTLRIQCRSANGDEAWVHVRPDPWYVQYAIDGVRPTVVEAAWTVPAGGQCNVRLDFDKAFVHFTQHRPDASRGFEIGAAIVTIPARLEGAKLAILRPPVHSDAAQGDQEEGETIRLVTDVLQVQLPIPDFSMPYNVITFTSTVLAFFFGTMFAMTVKRAFSYRMVDRHDAKGKVKTEPEIVRTEDRVKLIMMSSS
ncbi:GPI transamidase component PIG-T [Blastocladiella britannica]|nr:GPI transamidase component PIG-T [Blastocladiella britannica]